MAIIGQVPVGIMWLGGVLAGCLGSDSSVRQHCKNNYDLCKKNDKQSFNSKQLDKRKCLSNVLKLQGEENTRRHEEDGKVVMVTEHRVFDGGNRRGHIVIRVGIYCQAWVPWNLIMLKNDWNCLNVFLEFYLVCLMSLWPFNTVSYLICLMSLWPFNTVSYLVCLMSLWPFNTVSYLVCSISLWPLTQFLIWSVWWGCGPSTQFQS